MSSKELYTAVCRGALDCAVRFARERGSIDIGTEHILFGLCEETNGAASKILAAEGVTANDIRKAIGEIDTMQNAAPSSLTPSARRAIERAEAECRKRTRGEIGTEHLLYSLTDEPECLAVRILESIGVAIQDLRVELEAYFESRGVANDSKMGMKKCPTLSEYGRDLNSMALAGRFDPVVGREAEVERMLGILLRRTKNNPCLLGDPGVGKTAIVEELARRIAFNEVPGSLAGKRIVSLDIPAMLAGAKYRGEFEERLKNVMTECESSPDIILFADEIHTLVGAGGAEGAVDAANIIKPALARGELQLIGATTVSEYRKHIEKDAAFERRFQPVMINEPTAEVTEKILSALREKYERHHGVKITDDVVRTAVGLAARFLTDRFFPDKAVDLIDEAASRVRMRNVSFDTELRQIREEKEQAVLRGDVDAVQILGVRERELAEKRSDIETLTLNYDDIARVITDWTSIPVSQLKESDAERLSGLAERLKTKVVGQDRAADALAEAIRRSRSGLSDPARPIGSFIFVGSTGVGKTELAKTLAEELFGSRGALIRFDMSEYMEKHSVSKLIGSPPGYIGYGEGGRLTEAVRRRPYSVILFDEIEKADAGIFDILLQILDDGILTDSAGHRADFKNTVIIMTSNVGTRPERTHIGFVSEDRTDDVKAALSSVFSPEFLNRIDDIIVFSPLDLSVLEKISQIMISKLKARLRDKGIELEISPSAVERLAKEGYDERYGARHLRRAMTRLFEDALSDMMLEGSLREGDRVAATLKDGEIIFEKRGI